MTTECIEQRPIFTLPYLLDEGTPDWGPSASQDVLQFCLGDMASYPFEAAVKQERLGRVCDFTYSTLQRQQRDGRGVAAVVEDEQEFQLVDSRPVKLNRFQQNRFVPRNQQPRRDQINQKNQQQQVNQHQAQQPMRGPNSNQQQSQRQYQQQQQQRQQLWQRHNRQRLLAEWSIEPQHDWALMEVRQLAALPTLTLDKNAVTFKDIDWRGELRTYKKLCDKISLKNCASLSTTYAKELAFYWPGTADDSIIVTLFDTDPTITVAATSQILSCLMAAAQSRISWHLNFHKTNGRLFIDKQNGSSVDLLTVDETHKDPPLSDCTVRMNRPAELAAEALKINQNFCQQVLDHKLPPVKTFEEPPFVDEGDTPSSKVYRYRLVTLPGQPGSSSEFARNPLKIITRAEIDAVLPGTEHSYVNIYALNEYNPSRSIKPWKLQLERQQGALLAQEAKNNHFKVGKWVCQSMIAGAETIKIGFVTRDSPDSHDKHSILNIQTFQVKDIGAQIGLKAENAWAIVRAIVDLVMAQPDGKYVLIKDPVKAEIKLYKLKDDEKKEEQTDATGDSAE